MASDTTFQLPDTTALITKERQLTALRIVRQFAVVNFKNLEDERVRKQNMLHQLTGGKRGGNYNTVSFQQSDTPPSTTPLQASAPAPGIHPTINVNHPLLSKHSPVTKAHLLDVHNHLSSHLLASILKLGNIMHGMRSAST